MHRAVTRVKYGREDGEVFVFDPGEEVNGIDDEAVDQLLASGAIEEVQVVGEVKAEAVVGTAAAGGDQEPTDDDDIEEE